MSFVKIALQRFGRMLTRLPKLLPLLREVSVTLAVRLKTKGARSAWIYGRYYFINLFVSFANCHFNSNRVECPCCGWRGYDFIPVDGVIFWERRMVCPSCLSYARHRAFFLYVTRRDDRLLQAHGITLHLAPESYVTALASRNAGHRYLVADLNAAALKDARAEAFQADIRALPLSGGRVNILICFHVLEHIADDHAAISELNRVLAPGGVAYIMVPLDFALEKTLFFEQPNAEIYDHYWAPARDYETRFTIFDEYAAVAPQDYLTPKEAFRYGTPPNEIIFVCTKKCCQETSR